MDELTLFDTAVLVSPDALPASATIQDRFEAFHAANPWVCDALERLTQDMLDRGHQRVGVKCLIEVIRWQYERQTVGSRWRLNNVFTSRYARLLLERHPEWDGVFEVRGLRAA